MILKRLFLTLAIAGVTASAMTPESALADGGGGKTVCHDGVCIVIVGDPGHTRGTGSGSGNGACAWHGKPVPCVTQSGWFNAQDGCYYNEANPYPTSGPAYEAWKTGGGAIYWASCPFGNGSGGYVWLPAPPAGLRPSPGELAKRAAASFKFPKPSGHRSPSENRRYHGFAFTYVNLWLYDWTDPGTWKTLTATARAGGNWARVTATPTALTYDPGDGSAAVSCDGPGRPWIPSDGYSAPSNGACGYKYTHVTSSPITATQSIVWKITWVGSGGSSGSLPDQSTSTSGQLQVLQVQVVTR